MNKSSVNDAGISSTFDERAKLEVNLIIVALNCLSSRKLWFLCIKNSLKLVGLKLPQHDKV